MLRLANRLMIQRPVYGRLEGESEYPSPLDDGQLKYLRSVVSSGPVVIADDLVDLILESDKEEWNASRDCPNSVPPFPAFTVDCQFPEKIARGGECHDPVFLQVGFVCTSLDLQAEGRRSVPIGPSFKAYSLTNCAPAGTRWIVAGEVLGTVRGQIVHAGGLISLYVSDRGDVIERRFARLPGAGDGQAARLGPGLSAQYSFVGMLAMSFMNCKNVQRVDATETVGPDRKWHQRTKTPKLKYYTLEISQMRRVLKTEGRSDEVGLKRALHICRGHFANYTDEAPLFGRLTGQFWIPQHVRGTKEAGEIKKDYRLKIPQAVT